MDDNLKKLREQNEKKSDTDLKVKMHNQQIQVGLDLQKVIFDSVQDMIKVMQGNATKGEAISRIVTALDKLEDKVEGQTKDTEAEIGVLKAGLETLQKELKEVPTNSLKQLPKFLQQREEIKVNNLGELITAVNEVKSAVNKQNLTIKAPDVKVDAPKVTVTPTPISIPRTDFTPLLNAMVDVATAVQNIDIPEIPVTDLTKLEKNSDKSLKLLEAIRDRPIAGGSSGGGGGQSAYKDSTGSTALADVILANGKNAVAVVNPDGTNIGGSSSGGTSNITQVNSTNLTGAWLPVRQNHSASTTGTITANGQTVTTADADNVGAYTVTVSGTHAGVNLAFEGFDGTNWFSVLGATTSAANPTPATTTGVITTNVTSAWNITFFPGFTQFRVRATAFTSGTMNIVILPSSQFIPQIQYVSGSVTAGVTGYPTSAAAADALANPTITQIGAINELYNTGTGTWDRQRNNGYTTLLTSAARTTAQNGADQTNYNWRGIQVILNVTAASGTGGLTVNIQGKASAVASYFNLNNTPTAVTATGTYVYEVYQGASGTATGGITQRTDGIVSRIFRVNIGVGDASSYTYTLEVLGVV